MMNINSLTQKYYLFLGYMLYVATQDLRRQVNKITIDFRTCSNDVENE